MEYRKNIDKFMDAMTGSRYVESYYVEEDSIDVNFYTYNGENIIVGNRIIEHGTYYNYFNKGNAIEKIFVIESVRLLRDFKAIETVNMTLVLGDVKYESSMNRYYLNEILRMNISELDLEDGSWIDLFITKYSKGLYDVERRKLYDFFVTETKL